MKTLEGKVKMKLKLTYLNICILRVWPCMFDLILKSSESQFCHEKKNYSFTFRPQVLLEKEVNSKQILKVHKLH